MVVGGGQDETGTNTGQGAGEAVVGVWSVEDWATPATMW